MDRQETPIISDSLDGRRALVTGGSKGMGAAIAARLTAAGAVVMATARHRIEVADPSLFVVADVAPPREPGLSSTPSTSTSVRSTSSSTPWVDRTPDPADSGP